ncbi:MAG: GNAT family N-acetyltransferase [Actinomycetes bacterium]
MTNDDEQRQRIIDAAAELFAENGYGGTNVRLVAQRAGVTVHTVKRLTSGKSELFAEVMAAKVTSDAADLVAAAVADPHAEPPLAVMLEAVAQIFAAPERSWNALELEALISAHRDDDVRALESARFQERWANMKAVTEHTRRVGGIDPDVNDDAFVYFALALSVGMAVVDPLVSQQPSQANWNALMARIGAAIAPVDLLAEPESWTRKPWRLRIDIVDRPGGLATLIRALSTLHVYVVRSTVLAVGESSRTIDLAVTLPEQVSSDSLLAAAMSAGSNGYVTEGSPDDGLDIPTRVLDGARELVKNPGSGPLAAAMLVEADRFEVTDAAEGEDDAADVLRLQWTFGQHVVLHRDWAPFARAEKTRASSLLRLATALSSLEGDAEARGWVEPIKGGETVWIRLARPDDADAVAAMHKRCSERTRFLRYLQAVSEWRDLYLRWLSGGHRGATLVAMSEEGTIVGLGNVFPDESDRPHVAEIAVIIEDDYQNRGLGTRMIRHMLELAEQLGFHEVIATVSTENTGMLRVFELTRLDWSKTIEQGVATMRAVLPTAPSGEQAPSRLL